jgi:hypothetical protein
VGVFACAIVAAGKPVNTSALDALFDNTLKITSSAGEEYIYFNRDGTFTSTGPAGDTFGTWRINGTQICTKTKDASESCGVIDPNRSVGDHWEHTINGETVSIDILKGR